MLSCGITTERIITFQPGFPHGFMVANGSLLLVGFPQYNGGLTPSSIEQWQTKARSDRLGTTARELLSPSVQLGDFVNTEGAKKIQSVRRIVGGAAGLSEDDPRLLPCMLSVVAPCIMLIVAGNRMPGPVQEIVAMQAKALTTHFKLFSLAGLKAIREQGN